MSGIQFRMGKPLVSSDAGRVITLGRPSQQWAGFQPIVPADRKGLAPPRRQLTRPAQGPRASDATVPPGTGAAGQGRTPVGFLPRGCRSTGRVKWAGCRRNRRPGVMVLLISSARVRDRLAKAPAPPHSWSSRRWCPGRITVFMGEKT